MGGFYIRHFHQGISYFELFLKMGFGFNHGAGAEVVLWKAGLRSNHGLAEMDEGDETSFPVPAPKTVWYDFFKLSM